MDASPVRDACVLITFPCQVSGPSRGPVRPNGRRIPPGSSATPPRQEREVVLTPVLASESRRRFLSPAHLPSQGPRYRGQDLREPFAPHPGRPGSSTHSQTRAAAAPRRAARHLRRTRSAQEDLRHAHRRSQQPMSSGPAAQTAPGTLAPASVEQAERAKRASGNISRAHANAPEEKAPWPGRSESRSWQVHCRRFLSAWKLAAA
jgi:hypothetical protein